MSYNNELITKKPWLHRNWKWFVPTTLIIVCFTLFIMAAGDFINAMGTAMADPELIEKAREEAERNKEVTTYFGSPLQIGNIIDGDLLIDDKAKTIRITVPLKGNKGSGKIDIYAHLAEEKWQHDSIDVRLKKPEKRTFKVLR